MKCPMCGNELRRSDEEPTKGLCDSCKAKFDWMDDDGNQGYTDYSNYASSLNDYGVNDSPAAPIQYSSSKKRKKHTGLIVVGMCFMFLLGAAVGAFAVIAKLSGGAQNAVAFLQQPESFSEDMIIDSNPINNIVKETKDNINSKSDEESKSKPESKSDPKEESEKKAKETLKASEFSSGQYKVGSDIPAGEYILIANNKGYFCVSSDSNGSDIIFNDNFETNSIITITDGEYLELSRCTAYPFKAFCELYDIDISDTGIMLKIGVNLDAGEYKLESDDKGYYCIYSDSRRSDIIANDNFTGQAYVTVQDGQYLELTRCRIVQ